MRRTYVSLPEELIERLDARADARGSSSRAAAIRDLLAGALNPDDQLITTGQLRAFYAKATTLARLMGNLDKRELIRYTLHEARAEFKRPIEKPEQLTSLEANDVLNRLEARVHEFEVAARAPDTPAEKEQVPT